MRLLWRVAQHRGRGRLQCVDGGLRLELGVPTGGLGDELWDQALDADDHDGGATTWINEDAGLRGPWLTFTALLRSLPSHLSLDLPSAIAHAAHHAPQNLNAIHILLLERLELFLHHVYYHYL